MWKPWSVAGTQAMPWFRTRPPDAGPRRPAAVLVGLRAADVLDHADAGDGVEVVVGEVAVVADDELAELADPASRARWFASSAWGGR